MFNRVKQNKLQFSIVYYDVTDGKCKNYKTWASSPLEAEDNLRKILPENGHYEVWSVHIKRPLFGREVIPCEF